MTNRRPLLSSSSPRAVIGLFPDVGSAYVLSRLPGGLGQYLGLTGTRLRAADLLHCGLATHLVPREKWENRVFSGVRVFYLYVLCVFCFLWIGCDFILYSCDLSVCTCITFSVYVRSVCMRCSICVYCSPRTNKTAWQPHFCGYVIPWSVYVFVLIVCIEYLFRYNIWTLW